jgi:hypothetical protein
MKKLLLSFVLSAACALPLLAAAESPDDGKNVSVSGTEVVRLDGNTVSVVFQLHVGTEVTAKNRSLILRPIIQGLDQRGELPPIIIRGEKSKSVSENRAMSLAGVDSEGRYITSNGGVLDYYATIPWDNWMRGSQLVFEGINAGKGTSTEVNVGVVAENLLTGQSDSAFDNNLAAAGQPQADPVDAPAPTTPAVPTTGPVMPTTGPVMPTTGPVMPTIQTLPQVPGMGQPRRTQGGSTIGDELASRFTFVEPIDKYNRARESSSIDAIFDYNMPIVFGTATAQPDDDVSKFVEMTREGALYVRFERGSNVPDRSVGQNNNMLVDLLSSIRILDTSPQTRISQVVVVGFSAPEGSADEKETLAMERAGAVRNLLTANTRIDPAVISIYNGSVDWVTLRALVADSNMPDKYKVLDIIDNVDAWGNTRDKDRLTYLQELNNGDAFLYIREHFFPQLRQTGAYVKVYYENVM